MQLYPQKFLVNNDDSSAKVDQTDDPSRSTQGVTNQIDSNMRKDEPELNQKEDSGKKCSNEGYQTK